tara:strand:- start:299 stop:727 length:429 start_codon:yes stop_codon:yes gene_type:complete
MWLNIGVIPFWLMLIIFPQTKVCGLFVTSIIPTFILVSVYVYLLYIFFFAGYDFDKNFTLYLSFYDLAELFESNEFLILFWTHFLAINLFCGSWIVRDSQRFYMSKILVFFPLIITYFVGPLGIFIYWVIRIFFAKRITLFD